MQVNNGVGVHEYELVRVKNHADAVGAIHNAGKPA
jgi:hypothetical protein